MDSDPLIAALAAEIRSGAHETVKQAIWAASEPFGDDASDELFDLVFGSDRLDEHYISSGETDHMIGSISAAVATLDLGPHGAALLGIVNTDGSTVAQVLSWHDDVASARQARDSSDWWPDDWER